MADIAFFEGRQSAQVPLPPGHEVVQSSALRTMGIRLDCNPVGSIIVTPIVQDMNVGDFVRELRIFSLPFTGADPELLLSVRLHALTAKQLEIMTPPSSF
jgi:hypothetical protein